MSQILALRDAVVAGIKTLTGWKDVKGHYGRFSDQQLADFLMAAPAVRVAVLGFGRPDQLADPGSADYPVQLGVFIVTKDSASVGSRDETAIMAVEGISLLCNRNDWGLRRSGVRMGEVHGAQNLYNEKGMKDGVALWALDLRHLVRIATPDPATYTLQAAFLGTAPDIGTAHVDDYVQIGGAAS